MRDSTTVIVVYWWVEWKLHEVISPELHKHDVCSCDPSIAAKMHARLLAINGQTDVVQSGVLRKVGVQTQQTVLVTVIYEPHCPHGVCTVVDHEYFVPAAVQTCLFHVRMEGRVRRCLLCSEPRQEVSPVSRVR